MIKTAGLTKTAVRSTLWIYATFVGNKGLVFITTIILARLLAPEDFGLLALGMLAINYLDTIDDLGIGDALIYYQKDPDRTLNTAFLLNLVSTSLITMLAYFSAPFVAEFFHDGRVTEILKVLSIVFILASVGRLLEARLRKSLDFKSRFWIEFGKALFKGGVSIALALMGYGVWSLVYGQILGTAFGTLLYWIKVRWRPQFVIDREITKSLLHFGLQMTLVSILGMIHKNIDYVIVGYRMDAIQLGYYTMGFRLPELVVIGFCQVAAQILFPAYAKMQNQLEVLRAGYTKTLRYISLVTVPAGIGMFMIAPDFVRVFYTERWAPAIPVVQALSIYALVYSLSYNAGDIYKATGRPGILNKLSIVKLLITLPALWIAASYGIFYIALAQVLTTIILTLIRLGVASRVIGLKPRVMLDAIVPALFASTIMLVGTYAVSLLCNDVSGIFRMLILIFSSGIFYISALWIINPEVLKQAVSMIRHSLRSQPKDDSIRIPLSGSD